MVELSGAFPDGYAGGQLAACPAGTERHANGGACATPGTAASVYVGPHARVLGGNVSGSARIEDQATVVRGNVSGGTVGGLTIVGTGRRDFSVSGSATVRTTFLPLGWFGGNSVSGSATLVGDAEYNTDVQSGFHYGHRGWHRAHTRRRSDHATAVRVAAIVWCKSPARSVRPRRTSFDGFARLEWSARALRTSQC